MYDVGSKLLSGIKSMHIDSLACVRVKEGVSEQFRKYSVVRHGCIVPSWIFNVYIYGCSDEGGENWNGKEESEIHGGEEREEINSPLVCR